MLDWLFGRKKSSAGGKAYEFSTSAEGDEKMRALLGRYQELGGTGGVRTMLNLGISLLQIAIECRDRGDHLGYMREDGRFVGLVLPFDRDKDLPPLAGGDGQVTLTLLPGGKR